MIVDAPECNATSRSRTPLAVQPAERYRRWIVSIGLLLLCFGPISILNGAVDQNPAPQPAVAVEEELSEADQLAFAEALEQAAKDGESEAWNKLIDWSSMLDMLTAGETSDVIDKARADFKAGFLGKQVEGNEGRLCDQIIENSKKGGSFKFLRLSRVDQQPIALFRLILPNQGGVNYHQYFLKRSEDGLVRAVDIYVFLSAERLTDTLRVFWRSLVAEVSKNFIDRLFKPADPLIVSVKSITEMRALILRNEGEKALEVYKKLPDKVRALKVLKFIRLQAAQQSSEEEYAQAIDDFRESFPGDAALDFILIDGYLLKQNYEKSLECINRTCENLGGDAWLVALRAMSLANLERFDQARDAANEALQLEPDLLDIYWIAITVSLKAKDFDETAKHLTTIEREFEVEITDLTGIPDYAEFVESPQYEKWFESRN